MIQEKLSDEEIFKEKKKFLKRYSRIRKKIERLEEKLLSLDDRLTSVGAQKISDMPRGGIPVTIVDMVTDKMETQERINALLKQASDIRREILQVLDTLDDYRHVEVLELFFIDGLSLESIADKCGYSVRHTIRFYAEGINLLQIKCQ